MGEFDNEIKEENGQMTFDTLRIGPMLNARQEYQTIGVSNMERINRKDLIRAGLEDQRMASVNSVFTLFVMGKHGIALKDIPKFERGELQGHDKEAYLKEFEQFVKDHPVHETINGKIVNYPEGAKAWAEVYREANKKLKQYEIPNIDFGDPEAYTDNMEEMGMISKIGTDMVQLLDQQMDKFKTGELNQAFSEGFGSQKEQGEFVTNLQNLQFVGGFLESCTDKYRKDNMQESIDTQIVPSAYARDYAHKNQHLYGGKTLHEFRQNMPHSLIMSNAETFMPNAMRRFSDKTPEEQKALRDFMEKGTPLPKKISDTMDQEFTMLTQMIYPQMQGEEVQEELKRKANEIKEFGNNLKVKGKVIPSVADMDEKHRQVALRGFFDHIQPAFRMYGTMGSLDACSMDYFDLIQIDGKQLRQHCEAAYNENPAFEKANTWKELSTKQQEQYMMMEVMRATADPAYNVEIHDLVVDHNSIPRYADKTTSVGTFSPQAKRNLEKAKLKAEATEKKNYEKRKKAGKLTLEEKAALLRRELNCEPWYDAMQNSGVKEATHEFGDFCKTDTSKLCRLRDAPVGPQTVFQVWLMGQKGMSMNEVIDMYRPENLADPLKRAKKDLLVDEFKRFVKDHPTEKEISDIKTEAVPENLKIWGKVYKNAMEKIREHRFPDISVADSNAFAKYTPEFVAYFNLGINITQEAERMYHQGSDPGYAGPFIDGMGGVAAFREMSNLAGVLQVMGNAAQSCYRVSNGQGQDAVAFDQVSGRLFYDAHKDVYKGKTIGEVASDMNTTLSIMNCTSYKDLEDYKSGPEKLAAKTEYLKDFLKGKVKGNELTQEIYLDAEEAAGGILSEELYQARNRFEKGINNEIDQRYQLFAKEDGNLKEVKDLTPEELDKAYDLYQCSYGAVLESSTYVVMGQNMKKDYSDMIRINGKTARELFENLYKDLPPLEKEKRIMAEVMKASVTPGNRIEIDTITLDNGRLVSGELRQLDPYVAPKSAMEAEKKEAHQKEEVKQEQQQKQMNAAYVAEQQKIDAKEDEQQKKEERQQLEEEENAKEKMANEKPVENPKENPEQDQKQDNEENLEENPEGPGKEKDSAINLEDIKEGIAAGAAVIKEGIEEIKNVIRDNKEEVKDNKEEVKDKKEEAQNKKEEIKEEAQDKKEEIKEEVKDKKEEVDQKEPEKAPEKEADRKNPKKYADDFDFSVSSRLEDSQVAEEAEKADYKVLENAYLRRESDTLMAAVNKIDFNLLGKGSPEFTKMKESVKELQDYAYGRGQRMLKDGTDFNVLKYYDKLYSARENVKSYLDHKWEQIQRDPARKENSTKQKREQLRIAGAVQILEKMDQELAKGEKAIVDAMKEKYRNVLKSELVKEENYRNDPGCKEAGFVKSVARTAEIYRSLNGSNWEKRNTETFDSYYKRIHDYASSKRFANGRDKDLAQKVFANICKQAKTAYKEHKPFSNEEVKKQYINSMPENLKYVEEKDMPVYSAKEKIKEAQVRAQDYGGKLFSKKTSDILAKQTAERSLNPKNDPKREMMMAIVDQEAKKSVTELEKSGKVDKKVKELAKAYVVQEMKKEIAQAGKKSYFTTLDELGQEIDNGDFEDRFHAKVTNLLKDQNFIQMAKNDPEHCVENWTLQMEQAKENRHKDLMAKDKNYQAFAKKYPADYKERWDAAEDRLGRYLKTLTEETKASKTAHDVAYGDEPTAFNKKDPHYKGAREVLCNALATIAVQEIVKEKMAQKDLYCMELAVHPNKIYDMKKDIYKAFMKDELLENQNYVQSKLENLNALKEKGKEYALAAQQKRVKNKADEIEKEKKAAAQKELKQKEEEKAKAKEKAKENQPRKRSNSISNS